MSAGHVSITRLEELGFTSAADFYFATRELIRHRNREAAAAVLARHRCRLTDTQWDYVDHMAGFPPTGQLSLAITGANT